MIVPKNGRRKQNERQYGQPLGCLYLAMVVFKETEFLMTFDIVISSKESEVFSNEKEHMA